MFNILYAAGGQTGAGSGNPVMAFLPFIVIILVMYFLMIRPQSKKQKEKQNMLKELKAGDEVLTIGGLYGRIEGVKEKEDVLIVRLNKEIKINVARSAIANKVSNKIVS